MAFHGSNEILCIPRIGFFDPIYFESGIDDLDDARSQRIVETTSQRIANFFEAFFSLEETVCFFHRCEHIPVGDSEKSVEWSMPQENHNAPILSLPLRIALFCTVIFPLIALIYKAAYRGVALHALSVSEQQLRPNSPSLSSNPSEASINSHLSEIDGKPDLQPEITWEGIKDMTPRQFFAISKQEQRNGILEVFRDKTSTPFSGVAGLSGCSLDWPFWVIKGSSPRFVQQNLQMSDLFEQGPFVGIFFSEEQLLSCSPDRFPEIPRDVSEETLNHYAEILAFFFNIPQWVETHFTNLLCSFLPSIQVRSVGTVGGDKMKLRSDKIVPLIPDQFFHMLFNTDFSINRNFYQLDGKNHVQIRQGCLSHLFDQPYLKENPQGFLKQLQRIRDVTQNSEAFRAALSPEMEGLLANENRSSVTHAAAASPLLIQPQTTTWKNIKTMTPAQFYRIESLEERNRILHLFHSTQKSRVIFREEAFDSLADWSFGTIKQIDDDKSLSPLGELLRAGRLPLEVLSFLSQQQLRCISPYHLDASADNSDPEKHTGKVGFFLNSPDWIKAHFSQLLFYLLPPTYDRNSRATGGGKIRLESSSLVPLIHNQFFLLLFDGTTTLDSKHLPQSNLPIEYIRKQCLQCLFDGSYRTKDPDSFAIQLRRIRNVTQNSIAFQNALSEEMRNFLTREFSRSSLEEKERR